MARRGSKETSAAPANVVRSIAACQRCRIKKVKCDQNFPKCAKCERAGLECVGIDPATGREVPRLYVFHLEEEVKRQAQRIEYLERLVKPEDLGESVENESDSSEARERTLPELKCDSPGCKKEPPEGHKKSEFRGRKRGLETPGALPPGVPFAKLMETANKVSALGPMALVPGASVAPVEVAPAILPPRQTAVEFIRIFFAQSNSQLPVLHRETFLRDIFAPIYGPWEGPLVGNPGRGVSGNTDRKSSRQGSFQGYSPGQRSPGSQNPQTHQTHQTHLGPQSQANAQNQHLSPPKHAANHSGGVQNHAGNHFSHLPLLGESQAGEPWLTQYKRLMLALLAPGKDPIAVSQAISTPSPFRKPLFFLNFIFAISSSSNHLQYHTHISELFKEAAMRHLDALYASSDPLEQLEAILLQTLYSVMRPNVPGVWYLLGTALRLCVDLGLHKEELLKLPYSAYVKDRRRRLFWSAYSMDRQMCFYLGRPVGIPEESISVRYPSALDDSLIDPEDTTTKDFSDSSTDYSTAGPSVKFITLAFLRVRQIQLECQRILYENGELPRRFDSLTQWKAHISEELELWRAQCPRDPRTMNCDFNTEFFDLNYFHTLLLINGLSKKTSRLAPEAYCKVLDALRGLMACYTILHRKKAINYTWAAVHNLFMAGTSYLFVLYNSEHVRSLHPVESVKTVTEDCLLVLALLVASCTAAKACMDTFQMLTAVVLKIRYNVTVEGAMVANISTSGMKQNLVMVSGTGSLKGNLASLVEGITSESGNGNGNERRPEFSNVASPANFDLPRFGWVSRDLEQDVRPERSYDQDLPTLGMPDIHLEDFFMELENLSPELSIREPSAMDMALTQSDNVLASNGVQGDGRRVFELIQQMPFEPIWDQFFAGQNVPKQEDFQSP